MADISGDFRDGEPVSWAGKETTVRGAEHLFYGRQGRVVGEGKRLLTGKTVKVQFDELPSEVIEDFVPLSSARLPSSSGESATGAAPSVSSLRVTTGTVEPAGSVHIRGWPRSPKPVVTRSSEVIHCYFSELSRIPPPPLPGGFLGGDMIFFFGVSRTLRSGDKFEYGVRGEVVGPDTSAVDSDEKVNVRFPGNKNAVGCYLTTLSRAWPPPPELFKVGDCVHFTGPSATIDKHHAVCHGALGEVVGVHPAEPAQVSVRFPSNKGEIGCFVTELGRAWWRPATAVAR